MVACIKSRIGIAACALAIALAAVGAPLADAMLEPTPLLGGDVPQPVPLTLFALALIAIGTLLRGRGSSGQRTGFGKR